VLKSIRVILEIQPPRHPRIILPRSELLHVYTIKKCDRGVTWSFVSNGFCPLSSASSSGPGTRGMTGSITV